jgi:CubicO group peptidase (beta-lactamase class C family)
MEVVRSLVGDGIHATGAQLYVEHDGRVLCDEAFGAYQPTSLTSAYCATKPLLPIALAHLVDRGQLDLRVRVRSIAPDVTWVPPDATIADLLTHEAGLHEPTAALWRMTPRDRRDALLGPPASRGPAYSEVAAWSALAAVVAVACGVPAVRFVEAEVLEPAGLAHDIVVCPDRAAELARCGRFEVPVAGLPREAVPLLSERLPQQLADVDVAFGGLVSAAGLGRLYTALRRSLCGEEVHGMPSGRALTSLLRHRRARVWDATLQRPCSFAGGFMVGLDDHGVTDGLPAAIGHTSGIVTTFGLCDLGLDLAVGCCLNGVAMSSDDLSFVRRMVMREVLTTIEHSLC